MTDTRKTRGFSFARRTHKHRATAPWLQHTAGVWRGYRSGIVVTAAVMLSGGLIFGTYGVVSDVPVPVTVTADAPHPSAQVHPIPLVTTPTPHPHAIFDLLRRSARAHAIAERQAALVRETRQRPTPTRPTTTEPANRPVSPSPTPTPTRTRSATPTPTRTPTPARTPTPVPSQRPVVYTGVVMPTRGVLLGTYPGHTGVDVGIPGESDYGNAVRAAYKGTVVDVHYWNYSYGWHVVVRMPNGIRVVYAHLSRIFVHVGEWLSTGEVLGAVGHSGRATGSHLHLELVGYGHYGTLQFLRGDLTPFARPPQTEYAFKTWARTKVADPQFVCLNLLWEKESGWNRFADNPYSDAYGIPQSLPGSKMASFGSDWQWNGYTQMRWGLHYIWDVYGSPCSAWHHSQATNWY